MAPRSSVVQIQAMSVDLFMLQKVHALEEVACCVGQPKCGLIAILASWPSTTSIDHWKLTSEAPLNQ